MKCPLGYGRPAPPEEHAPPAEGDCYYADYLKCGQLLSAQQPLSDLAGEPAHDELLFIITHQAYELWFKQILHELWSVHAIFTPSAVSEVDHLVVVQRLTRVVKIFKLLVSQFEVLETMTPMDFLEFRGHLTGASGFQSLQFRSIEALLGVPLSEAMQTQFNNRLGPFELDGIKRAREMPSLLTLVEKWLERTPGIGSEFEFWSVFKGTVKEELAQHREIAERAGAPPTLVAECDANEANYDSIFNAEAHAECKRRGTRRMSQQSIQGAILISLYRDQPRFHTAHQILSLLMDVDSLLAKWRYEHVMMVHRMIGTKIGTGGSSGYAYLRSTLNDEHRIFTDLFNMTAFLVPKNQLPPLSIP